MFTDRSHLFFFLFVSKFDSVMCLGNLIEMTCYCVNLVNFCFLFLSYLRQCGKLSGTQRCESFFVNGIFFKRDGYRGSNCPVPGV